MDVVFIHYFGGKGESWQWMDGFVTGITPYYITLPGFGGTQALESPDIYKMAHYVLDYLKYHNISTCVLAGHSMGGKIALLAAALATNVTIEKVILVAPSPPTIEAMPDAERKRMLIHPDYAEAKQTVTHATYRTLPEPKMEFAIETQLQVEEHTWKWWLEKGMQHSILSDVANVTVPMYLICSEDDKAITPSMIKDEVLTNLTFEIIYKAKNVGHLMPIEKPEYLAAVFNNIMKHKNSLVL